MVKQTHSHKQLNSQKGIYFVSTLIVAVLISMLVTAAIFSVRGNLGASRHLAGGDAALKAADSGLRYAQAKLSENPDWRGDDNGITVNSPDLVIEENNGNVVGIIRSSGGPFSQFRLRFNYQDDAQGDVDGLADPPRSLWVDHPYLSINNLNGSSETAVPRGDGPAQSVTQDSEIPYQVPSGTVCLAVEGRAGPGLSGLGPANLNPSVLNGSVTRKTVEAYFRFGSQPGADASAMAAGNVHAQLLPGSGFKFSTTSKSGIPVIRSKKLVTVEGGSSSENYSSPNGEVHSGDNDLHANSTVGTRLEDPTSDFYKLTWDKVRKADPGGDKLPAGTYVIWDDQSVHYYNMNYDDYLSHIASNPNAPGTIVSLETDSSSLSGTRLTISGDLYIEPTAGPRGGDVDEFNLIPRKGAQEDPPGAGGGGPAGPYTAAEVSAQFNSLNTPSPGMGGDIGWQLPNSALPASHPNGLTFQHQGQSFQIQPQPQGVMLSYNNPNVDNQNPYSLSIYHSAAKTLLETLAGAPPADPDYEALMATFFSDGSGGGMEEIPLPGVNPPPSLSADDMSVEFKPKNAKSAILSAQGNVNLASRVRGTGGSITSEGDIRMVGAGTSLAASLDEGLNLYAKGDVVLSSLKPANSGGFEYKSFRMKGVIYTWGDFIAKIGHEDGSVGKWGDFTLQGSLVAYGNKGNAALGEPGDGQGGDIRIKARQVKLQFDPAYLSAIQQNADPGHLRQASYTIY